MRSLSFLILLVLFPFLSSAQFKINGQLKSDSETVLNDVVVKLKQDNELIKSTFSDENGIFVFTEVSSGSYVVEFVSIYFESKMVEISVNADVHLGKILLFEIETELEELVINTRKNPIKRTEKGVVINVAETRLKNKPDLLSVLDYAPNISLVNGLEILGSDAILVVLDGKEIRVPKERIGSFLNTFNLKTIQNIEVIDRVDGSTDSAFSGIIKISTIQKNGWNGSIRQSVNYSDFSGANTDVSLFYTQDNFRLFGSYYFMRHKSKTSGIRKQILENENLLYDIIEDGKLKRKNDYATFGADYNFNENNSLSFFYLFENDQDVDHERTVLYDITNLNNGADSLIVSKTRFDQINKMHSFSLSFDRITDTLNSKLNTSFDLVRKNYQNPFLQNNFYQNNQIEAEDQNQRSSTSNNTIYAFNTSWNKNLKKNKILTLGARFTLVDNEDFYNYYDLVNQDWVFNPNISNDFFLKEYVASVFSTFSLPVKEQSKLSFGLRAEYNYNDFTNKIVKGNNDNFRLLPNILYNTKLWGNSFYTSVSQRLLRPNYDSFNPTFNQSNPTSAFVGNENLKPVDIYHFQTGYRFKNNLSLDARYSYYQNNIVSIPTNINGLLVNRPENKAYRNDVFFNVAFPYKISDWWETYTKVTAAYLSSKLPTQNYDSFYGTATLNNTFYLPLDIELQLYYTYTSKYKLLYTQYNENNSLNVRVTYPISEAFTLNTGVSDIFRSIKNESNYHFNGIYNEHLSRYNSRIFSFSITYNFTKGKEVSNDIRETNVENEKGRW